MKWVAVSGSWRKTNKRIEEDVRKKVREIFRGDCGFVSGGALGVDYFATDEALKLNPKANKIKIFLPTAIETYKQHYLKRAREGVIGRSQAESLISQLERILTANKNSIIEMPENKQVNKKTYKQRIDREVAFSDELIAFHVNGTEGVQYTIDKANEKGIQVHRFKYAIKD